MLNKITDEVLDNRFKSHPPTEDQKVLYRMIQQTFRSVASVINDHCPPSRETSLALTKLEEAMMHSNSAIARHSGKPEEPGIEVHSDPNCAFNYCPNPELCKANNRCESRNEKRT